MLLLVLIAAAVTATFLAGALAARGYGRECVRVGYGAQLTLWGVAFLFYGSINLGYRLALPFWMVRPMLGPDPVTRESRPWAYWYGIATILGFGIFCVFVGIVLCLLHGSFSAS